jgi:cysteine-rich repeat protein
MKTSLKLIALIFLFVNAYSALAQGNKGPQAEGVQDLINATDGKAQISVDENSGLARFVRLPQNSGLTSYASDKSAPAQLRATKFLSVHGKAFGVTNVRSELEAAGTSRDAMGNQHSVFKQVYNGLPVFGAELRAHFNQNGELFVVNGNFLPEIKASTNPNLTAIEASERAIRTVGLQQYNRKKAELKVGDKVSAFNDDFSDLMAVSTKLMIFRSGMLQGVPGIDHLAFEVQVANVGRSVREFVYVDAHNGKVIDQITGIYDALDRRAYDAEGFAHPGPNYPASPFWVEGDPIPTTDAEADNMILASGETYNFFFSAFLRDGFDGAGATMDSIFNRGDSCPNASWNGIYISFCPGLTTDDITGHEWAHAYTEYTNGLIYQWQSGALNESYSDIWGETVDLINGRGFDVPGGARSDGSCSDYGPGGGDDSVRWLLGEESSIGALRDMWNPTCAGDPGKVTDGQYWCTTGDNGGVHFNSGVPNHAYTLMVDGGNYNGYNVAGLGLTKAAHIQWAAQNMLIPSSNFLDNADALEAACSSLIGTDLNDLNTGAPSGEVIDAGDCAEVADAIAAVEFRTVPDQCGFVSLLAPDAPALCEGLGSVQTNLVENFESGALPAGWTASSHDVVDPGTFDSPGWSVESGLPGGNPSTFAAFAPDLAVGDCAADTEAGAVALDSPPIALPAGEVPRVAFDHWVATEAGWDGGNLKVSVNGGPWTVVPASAYSFNPNNSVLNVSDNPLGGEEAFTGTDGGSVGGSWGQSQVNLYGLAFPGDSIQLRFDLGTDGCFGIVGWYVDNVNVYSCSAEALPICGDSSVDPGEMCDDGNMDDGDGCSNSCQVESGWVCSDPMPARNSTNIVADFSFEQSFNSGEWTASSTFGGVTGFPLCGPGNSCPAAGLANTGSWLVWIGGLSNGVTSSVEQSVTIPASATELTLQTLRGVCDDVSDTLHVQLDGADIGSIACDATEGSFVEQTFSVAGYNDGGTHTLYIGGTVGGTNGTHSNFFVDDVAIEDNQPVDATASMCMEIVEDLACNAGTVGFDAGIAGSWSVVDNEGTGVVWTDIASSGLADNFTGGSGEAASVSSDAFIFTEFDTELISNSFSLQNQASAALEYRVNYQNLAGLDFLDVDISTDGGSNWTNLLSWNEDHPPGGLFFPPGEAVSIDLSAYLGEPDVRLRWHYYDPNSGDWDWYAQVDNVAITAPDDADCDGVVDSIDACPYTMISESVPTDSLGRNRWALTDGDTTFDTNGNKKDAYTLQDTAGCSCEQIIEGLELGLGHTKYGCSISAMEDWIDLMSQ